MKITTIIAVQFYLLISTNALSYTGNDFLADCKGDELDKNGEVINVIHASKYYSYIDGTLGAYFTLKASLKTYSGFICIPKGVTNKQIKSIVIKYVNDNPKNSHFKAADIILASLLDVFPCQDQETGIEKTAN